MLLGFVQRVRETSALTAVGPFRLQHDQSIASAVSGLGQTAFDAAFGRGRGMMIDDGAARAADGEHRPEADPGSQSRRLPY